MADQMAAGAEMAPGKAGEGPPGGPGAEIRVQSSNTCRRTRIATRLTIGCSPSSRQRSGC